MENLPDVFSRVITVSWQDVLGWQQCQYRIECKKGATRREDFVGSVMFQYTDILAGVQRNPVSGKIEVRLFPCSARANLDRAIGLFDRLPEEQGVGFTCDEFPW